MLHEDLKNVAISDVSKTENDGRKFKLKFDEVELKTYGSDDEMINTWINSHPSLNTRRSYERIWKDFQAFIHPKSLKDCTLITLQHFMGAHYFRSHETVRHKIAVLKSLFLFAVEEEYLPKNPALRLPILKSHSKTSQRRLDEEEVFRMIDRTTDQRDQAILRTLYNGSFRVSELTSLNWNSIHLNTDNSGYVTLIGKEDQQRTVGLKSTTLECLLKLKESANDFDPIFVSREGRRLSVRAVQEVLKNAALRAGIVKKVSPHWLRHAHATHALSRGAPLQLIQQTLGHKSITTTMHYIANNPNQSSGQFLGI